MNLADSPFNKPREHRPGRPAGKTLQADRCLDDDDDGEDGDRP